VFVKGEGSSVLPLLKDRGLHLDRGSRKGEKKILCQLSGEGRHANPEKKISRDSREEVDVRASGGGVERGS